MVSPLEKSVELSVWRKLSFLLVCACLLFGFTLVLDRCLGLLNYPDKQYRTEPNLEVKVENLEYQYSFRANDRGLRYRTISTVKPPRNLSGRAAR